MLEVVGWFGLGATMREVEFAVVFYPSRRGFEEESRKIFVKHFDKLLSNEKPATAARVEASRAMLLSHSCFASTVAYEQSLEVAFRGEYETIKHHSHREAIGRRESVSQREARRRWLGWPRGRLCCSHASPEHDARGQVWKRARPEPWSLRQTAANFGLPPNDGAFAYKKRNSDLHSAGEYVYLRF